MPEICQHCQAAKHDDAPKPWRCHRCGALVPWTSEPPAGEPIAFGPYLLVRRIAAGGMGVVYEARRKTVQQFEKSFAIKRLLPALSYDTDFISMLIDEAKISAQLEHPNIVQVFELDKVDSEYYIAMEYVPGSTFASMLRFSAGTRRMLPLPVVAHIVNETLKGLAYAHGRGRTGQETSFIHRDVSPQNIMIGRDGRIKLSDFGIAKAIASSTSTRVGSVKGKLAYMAPEILAGERASTRSDVWAMGVLIVEALTSRRLFRGDSEAAIISAVLHNQIQPLSRYRKDIPRQLEKTIQAALARDTSLRLSDADSLRHEFVAALPSGMLDDGLRSSEAYIADFYRAYGLPGEPLDYEADAPLSGRRVRIAQISQDAHPSDSFPTVFTHRRMQKKKRLIILGVATFVVTIGGLAAYFATSGPKHNALTQTIDASVVDAANRDSANVDTDTEKPVHIADAASTDLKTDKGQVKTDKSPTGRPSKLSRKDIIRTFQHHMAALNQCAATHQQALPADGVKVSLTIAGNGSVREAVLSPASLRGTGLDSCLAKIVAKMRFPRHRDNEAKVTVPLQFRIGQ